jgi:hypothetical protein
LRRRFTALKNSYLLYDRYASFLFQDSYAQDKAGLFQNVSLLDPDGYIRLLDLVGIEYECAHPDQPGPSPCAVKHSENRDADFLTQLPIVVKIAAAADATSPQHFIYETRSSDELASEVVKLTAKLAETNRAAGGDGYEPTPAFNLLVNQIRDKLHELED